MPTRSSVGAGRTSGVLVGTGTAVTVTGAGVWSSRMVSKSPQGGRLFGSPAKTIVSSGVTVAVMPVDASVLVGISVDGACVAGHSAAVGACVAAGPHAETIMALSKTKLPSDHKLILLYILSPMSNLVFKICTCVTS